MDETLGNRIGTNRKRLGFTQEQLAEQLGVTAQAVSKWENDQSCPDINMLPKLARIFAISTDELLGHTHEKVIYADPINAEPDKQSEVFNIDLGLHQRRGTILFSLFVLAVGLLFLLSQILVWDLSFWDVLWPTAIIFLGISGLSKKFSFFGLGCILVGGYFLTGKFFPISLNCSSGVLFAILILIFGVSLFVDAFQKKKAVKINTPHNFKKSTISYETDGTTFVCDASFCSCHQLITMPKLSRGEINNAFGEMTLDLSEVDAVTEDCTLDVDCSFGELKLMVPKRYHVKPISSTAFANFSVVGREDAQPEGEINLDVDVSFGEVRLIYI